MSFNIPITITGDVSTDGITRPSDSYGTLELGSVLELSHVHMALNENSDVPLMRCAACGEELSDDEPTQTLDGDTACSAREEEGAPHAPEAQPFAWCKNITVSFDEENDTIDLILAHADPRGGWAMRFWRRDDGQIMMSLPHEDTFRPHSRIKRVSEGTYEVGGPDDPQD